MIVRISYFVDELQNADPPLLEPFFTLQSQTTPASTKAAWTYGERSGSYCCYGATDLVEIFERFKFKRAIGYSVSEPEVKT